jgi:nucleotide-binding universal stress UspA family protein
MPSTIRTMMVAVALDQRDLTTLAHASRVAAVVAPETVYLVHVVKPSGREGAARAAIGPAADAAVREQLERLASAMSLPMGTNVECIVAHGEVVPTLLEHAGKSSTDLLVVGRSVDQRADESTRGAVRVLRKIPCSVLIVPVGAPAEYDRVVVAVDFSNRSAEALELAADLAKPGVELAAVHVYAPPLGYHKLGQTFDDAAIMMRAEVEREYREWLPTLDLGGVACALKFQLGEDVGAAIADCAEEQNADLVVVASHGRTQPAALLLGHVADAVCRRIARPMLCVKRKGEVIDLIRAIAQLYEWD